MLKSRELLICALAAALLAAVVASYYSCLWGVREVAVLRAPGNKGVNALVLLGDGRTLVAGCADGNLRLWDLLDRRVFGVVPGNCGPVREVAVNPEGNLIAVAGTDHTVRLLDLVTRRQVACLRGHAEGVRALAFSPDGRQLASAGYDRTVRLWDVADRTATAVLRAPEGPAESLVYRPDGKAVAASLVVWGVRSVDDAALVVVWDASSGEVLRTLQGGKRPIRSMLFIADDVLVFHDRDGLIGAWNPTSGERIASLKGHFNPIVRLARSDDRSLLASSDGSGGVIIWDAVSFQQKKRMFQAYEETFVSALVFGKDGRTLITACGGISFRDREIDGEIKVWRFK